MAEFEIRTLAYGKLLEKVHLAPGETSVTVPDGITRLGSLAFKGLTALEEVILPDSVEEFETHFYDCPALKRIRFSENLPGIAGTAFLRCTALEEIRLPANAREIGTEAFKDCTGLREVVLGEHTERICFRVFQGCTALQRVVFFAEIDYIKPDAFQGCTALCDLDFAVPPRPGSMLHLQITQIFQNDAKLAARILDAGNMTRPLAEIAQNAARSCGRSNQAARLEEFLRRS